jgi:hypothetical protein
MAWGVLKKVRSMFAFPFLTKINTQTFKFVDAIVRDLGCALIDPSAPFHAKKGRCSTNLKRPSTFTV